MAGDADIVVENRQKQRLRKVASATHRRQINAGDDLTDDPQLQKAVIF
jgi:hypothetical protein